MLHLLLTPLHRWRANQLTTAWCARGGGLNRYTSLLTGEHVYQVGCDLHDLHYFGASIAVPIGAKPHEHYRAVVQLIEESIARVERDYGPAAWLPLEQP